MRITNQMMAEQTLRNLTKTVDAMARVQDQVSSGKRLRAPSDDPAQVRGAIKIRESLEQIDQYLRNLDTGTRLTAGADTALADAGDVLQRARELAVQGANGSLSATDRQAMAQEVEQLTEQLVSDAAAKVGDRYIFSGFRIDVPPYVSTGPGTVGPYQGDGNAVVSRIGPGTNVQVNVAGDVAFGPAFTALAQLHAELAAGTQVSGGTLTAIDAGSNGLLNARAIVGARQNRLEQTQMTLQDGQIAATKLLSDLEDVDMTKAISELSQRQLTYNAALQLSGKILQRSLIDELQ
jgi:flagellar hook-associated protein 3 FlgL